MLATELAERYSYILCRALEFKMGFRDNALYDVTEKVIEFSHKMEEKKSILRNGNSLLL